jgi:hypothetical protein
VVGVVSVVSDGAVVDGKVEASGWAVAAGGAVAGDSRVTDVMIDRTGEQERANEK